MRQQGARSAESQPVPGRSAFDRSGPSFSNAEFCCNKPLQESRVNRDFRVGLALKDHTIGCRRLHRPFARVGLGPAPMARREPGRRSRGRPPELRPPSGESHHGGCLNPSPALQMLVRAEEQDCRATGGRRTAVIGEIVPDDRAGRSDAAQHATFSHRQPQ